MDQIKQNVAKNIARLRTSAHLTQAELAQRLCYSDKAVSKWERAESIPDISVLKQIADLFGVTVDYLITDTTDESVPLPPANRRRNHIIITLLSLAGVWFIALLAFTIFYTMNRIEWLIFLFAVPVSLIVGLVFASIWGTRMQRFWLVSALIWDVFATVYMLTIHLNIWLLFVAAIPCQIAAILSFGIRIKRLK